MLESKHVIGLFLLMLLFSGVFFTLGYVMGRNQYDGQVRAASNGITKSEPIYSPKSEAAQKKTGADDSVQPSDVDPSTGSSASAWTFPATNSPASADPHLDAPPVSHTATPALKPASPKSKVQTQPVSTHPASKSATPLIPSGAYVIQVAALLRQDDALAIASGLQKKHYAVYVQTPQKDKYYRVQVGPFRDQKSADAAKKGLEGEGFKAFYVKH